MIKVRLDPYYTKLKRKKGWIPCNDPHLLLCALWEHNDRPGPTNIGKISIPDIIPGYDFQDFIYQIQVRNDWFIAPEVIVRD